MPFGVARDWERQTLPRPEILSYPLETTVIDSVVVNATGITPDATGPYTGRRYLVAGTILSKRADNQYERFTATGGAAVNEVQTVAITGAPTGGTFTLSFGGQTTTGIAFNAAATAVDTALEALSSIGAGNVAVTGGPGPGTAWTVTFTGTLAAQNVALMTATGALTGGTAPAVTVAETTQGVAGGQAVAGILFDTVEFADASDASDEPVAMLRRNASFKSDKIVDYATHEAALKAALPSTEYV